MPTAIILPKQGNSVESCVINKWLKKIGDTVAEGEPICEVETDKASVEVLATAAGIVLAQFAKEGDDVPVMTAIAAIGNKGDDFSGLAPQTGHAASAAEDAVRPASGVLRPASSQSSDTSALSSSPASGVLSPASSQGSAHAGASPRARGLAQDRGVDVLALGGTGPDGLVITRDVQAAPRLTPAAQTLGGHIPASGTGIGNRITADDRTRPLETQDAGRRTQDDAAMPEWKDTPVKGVRKIIAERMRASLAGAAQLTLNAVAKADALQAWRAKAKVRAESLGLPPITINDLILFAVSRVLPRFPAVNAHWRGDTIRQFRDVHLGMAVDTEKGLLVPVLRQVQAKSLATIAVEAKALAKTCQAGKITPEALQGSTFSITNVGALGIESFTPVLNTPEVAILGVGAISLRPYEGSSGIDFIPSLHLSLTFDHQALDGAPAARFLQALVQAIESIDVLLAQ